ncbi:hypothetical protein PS15m_012189 [Mucor circinelloides]
MSSNEVSETLKEVKKGLVLLHNMMKLKYAPKLYIKNNLICFLMTTLSLVKKDNTFHSVYVQDLGGLVYLVKMNNKDAVAHLVPLVPLFIEAVGNSPPFLE